MLGQKMRERVNFNETSFPDIFLGDALIFWSILSAWPLLLGWYGATSAIVLQKLLKFL